MNISKRYFTFAATFLFSCLINDVYGHGFMASPRSRQAVAAEDGLWAGGGNLPEKENCPSCANIKNADGFCGKVQTRDYDFPKTGDGDPLPPSAQAVWVEGQYVEIDFVYTANHGGHHVTYACPDFYNPTKECFKKYQLEFIEDLTVETYGTTYNAPRDDNFPERAYVDPAASKTRHRFKLPDGLFGDPANDNLVLLQWHWVTGNSCLHEGYSDYNFPPGWSPDNMGQCPLPLSETGVEVPPEQFWNCAEVKITKTGLSTSPPTKPPSITTAPSAKNPAPVTNAPVTSAPTGSNGCCSRNFKTCDATWCGDTKEKCLACGSAGDKTWLPNGPLTSSCIPRDGACTNDVGGCCDESVGLSSLQCTGNQYYRQCVTALNPTTPATPSPTKSPMSSPTVPTTPSPTKSPVTLAPNSSHEGTLFSTSNTMSSYDALLELAPLTNVVQASSPPVWALVAEGGAAGNGSYVVSEGQGYAVMIAGIVVASMTKSDPNRADALNRFYAYFSGWKRMCENSTPYAYCQSQKLCNSGTTACLPGWKHDKDFTTVPGTGAAPDGDEDAILGMIMAIKAVEEDATRPSWFDEVYDWADASSTSFMLHNTKLSNTGKNRILKLGSCWGGWESDGNNPSYHSPGSWRLFRDFQASVLNRKYAIPFLGGTNDLQQEWTKLIETSYDFLDVAQCDDIGIVPNWALVTENGDGSIGGYPGSFSGSGTPQYEFGAEASRTIWRILLDVALHPNEAFEPVENFLNPLHGRLDEKFGSNDWPDNTLIPCDGVTNVFGGWRYNAFMYAPVYSSLVLEASGVSTSRQQEMIDAAGNIVNRIPGGTSYYSRCWAVIGIITMNGDLARAGVVATESNPSTAPPFTSPTVSPSASPTSSPSTSPTSASDVCKSVIDRVTCKKTYGCGYFVNDKECRESLSKEECAEFHGKRSKCKKNGCKWRKKTEKCKARWI